MKFVHLHTHSHYSLLDGLAKIDNLVNYAKELGMKALALTDHGSLYGIIEFYQACLKAEIKPILGLETYVAPRNRFEKEPRIDDKYFHLTLLAENQTGWQNLIKLGSKAHLEGFYYKPRVDKELLKEHCEGLIALSGCVAGEIPQAILRGGDISEAEQIIKDYQNIFGKENFFLEIGHHPNIPEVLKANEAMVKLSQMTGAPLVATQDIHYARSEDAEYHDILLAVQTGARLDDDDRLSLRADDFSMRSPEQMIEFFKDYPEAIENTVKIAERCNVELKLYQNILPEFPLPEEETSDSYLEKLVMEKFPNRYPKANEKTLERVKYELSVIEKTGFAAYFLIVQDFVNWAKSRGIMVGPGRGSAAGSIIAYILNITDVDPIKYQLFFERFLNPDRISMPDIDLDFTDVRRDEIFSYIREKYGEDKVARIITFGTMGARAAIRDATRALGLPYALGDQISKLIPSSQINPNQKLEDVINKIPELKDLYKNNPDAQKVIDAAKHLEGVARHASVHACGVVISRNPLTDYVPLQRSPQDPDITITQFDMNSISDIGLLKIDLLGLKNLTVIEETIKLIKELRDENIDISNIPIDDKKTFKLFQAADTTGVFQLESSGMRHYLKELKPTDFEDIVAMVALYRPGPMAFISDYIKAKHKEKIIQYIHPKLKPILENTYGICVYQEQVMQIARELCGFTLSEADILRKAIGKKIKALLNSQKEKFIEGAKQNEVKEEIALKIWNWIEPFASYSFNRAHAVCYALISYRTAYLKTHWPIEFMTSLFNADNGDVERIAFLVGEVKKMDIEILPPDINKSFMNFAPEDKNIRFGLLAIKNVGYNIVEIIINERYRGGPFENFSNFLIRVQHKDLNKKSLESLIKAGVFDSFNVDRNELLANIEEILNFSQNIKRAKNNSQNSLFGNNLQFNSLKLKNSVQPATPKEKLLWEKQLLGLYISGHPLYEHANKIKKYGVKPIKELTNNGHANSSDNGSCKISGVISEIKRVISKTGQQILFVKVEDMTDTLEMVVFSDTFSKNPGVWRENNTIVASGRLFYRNNEPKFMCQQAIEL